MLALLFVVYGVAGVVGGACCKLALLFVVYGVAGVVDGVAGCWRSIVVSLIEWHVAS